MGGSKDLLGYITDIDGLLRRRASTPEKGTPDPVLDEMDGVQPLSPEKRTRQIGSKNRLPDGAVVPGQEDS